MKLIIKNATVYDPKNQIEGETTELYIRDGVITRPFKRADREIDATGLWALPGGIEAGTSLATYGLTFYGFKVDVPALGEISRQYARMGYTHLHESMMFPITALSVHRALSALPFQDTSASLCLPLREFGTLIASNIPPEWTDRFFATCAQRFRALAVRLPEISAHFKESNLAKYNLPAQTVLDYLSRLTPGLPLQVELTSRLLDEELPHVPNLHYARIGRAIDGEYAYKQVTNLFAAKHITGDIGLAPKISHHQLKIEAEIGEGEDLSAYIGMHAPLRYLEVPSNSQSDYVLTLATHPEHKRRLAFSSICLGAEAGTLYPAIFRNLFEREPTYTLSDFVCQTRVMPAVLLGLENKGHLGIGAVGDVALYAPDASLSPGKVLGRCHTLIKNGYPVMEEGRFPDTPASPETKTYFRQHSPSERDFAMFAGFFKSYPRIEHLNVPGIIGNWEAITGETDE